MSWLDRLKEAAYTSPSGQRIPFYYEDVSREVSKKTTAYEFPDIDGTFVQDLGRSGRRYPLTVIFWGGDHDLRAEAFENLLVEKGVGLLEHPIYGSIDVVPFGSITRRNNLVSSANQTTIEVTFYETTGLVFPRESTDPAATLDFALETYNTALANTFNENSDLDTSVGRALFKNRYLGFLSEAKSVLQVIADFQDDIKNTFEAIDKSINQGIDILIATPLTLAFQTTLLIQAPARAFINLKARLEAYRNLAISLTNGDGAVVTAENEQEYRTRELFASTYATGAVLSALNNKYRTKLEAVEAVASTIEQFDNLVAWRDTNFNSFINTAAGLDAGSVDTGELYQALQSLVALAGGFLIDLSFDLRQEFVITTDRPRNFIELCAELYGAVDSELDFFINTNQLTGSEIIEIPKGRRIVYYL
jgi:hypothetical protein